MGRRTRRFWKRLTGHPLIASDSVGPLPPEQRDIRLMESYTLNSGKDAKAMEYIEDFGRLVSKIRNIPFVDCLAMFNSYEECFTVYLWMKDGTEILLGAMLPRENGNITYNIYRDGRFLDVGEADVDLFMVRFTGQWPNKIGE